MTVSEARQLYGDEVIDQLLSRMAAENEAHRRFLRGLYGEAVDDAEDLELPEGWERYLPPGAPPASI